MVEEKITETHSDECCTDRSCTDGSDSYGYNSDDSSSDHSYYYDSKNSGLFSAVRDLIIESKSDVRI